MPVYSKIVPVAEGPVEGFPGVVRAGPLVFVSGCDGHRDRTTERVVPELAGDAERQCENAYGRLGELLVRAGSSIDRVVRLDHLTSSQDWLARRQAVRERIFGKPAPLASTGVAAKMNGINMLTVSAIAVADANEKTVLVEGSRYAMPNLSSAVRGGPLVFMSGIRGTVDPKTAARVAEETPESFCAQTRVCYGVINSIVSDCGLDPSALLRLDCFLRDGSRADEEEQIRIEELGAIACASTRVALPLSARGEVEITALAAAPGVAKRLFVEDRDPIVVGAGGFLFVGECLGLARRDTRSEVPIDSPRIQLERACRSLESALREAGSALSNLVRLEVYFRDIYRAAASMKSLRRLLGDSLPSVVVAGAELEGLLEVKLNAIAIGD
jgi:enamine deaminase RidA (YjgF/YER057c/UK114 family)